MPESMLKTRPGHLVLGYTGLKRKYEGIKKGIGCPPRLPNIIASLHEDTHSTVSFKGAT